MIYEGRYSEGEGFRTVPVTLAPHGVSIESKPGHHDWWSFEVVRIQRHDAGIRFEAEQKALDITDSKFLNALAKVNPRVARGQQPETSTEFVMRLSLIVIVLLSALIGIVWAGIPLITSALAKSVPVSVEENLGKSTVDAMVPAAKRKDPGALNQVIERLQKASGDTQYKFQLIVADDATVNAFAAPGGYIVMCTGLLDKIPNQEEQAAVLAHEMQHVLGRHVLRALVRNVSLTAAISLATGDPTGAISQIGGTLASLHYQRGDEWNADLEGYKLLKAAGYNPHAMIAMLERLDKIQGEMPQAMHYLSTHPQTKNRIARLKDETD